jgi:hypothetical protein
MIIAVLTATSDMLLLGSIKNAHTKKLLNTLIIRRHTMPSINTSYHLDSQEIPQVNITTHYVKDKNGSDTENLNFHVFRIHTTQGESNYFIHTDEQLGEFIANLKSLTNQFDRISMYN